MEESTKTIIVLIPILIGLGVFVFLILFNIRQSEYAYRVLYEDLKTFKYFAENCSVSTINRDIILKRVKMERARDEFEEPAYCDLVNAIAQIYVKRFIHISGGIKTL
jgi:hypothetical protein